MAKAKKVILFIVEGSTDGTAFGLLFERVFKEHAGKFDIVGGDITTQVSTPPASARQRVRDRVLSRLRLKGYRWSDLERVVHIVDTDGAYVPDAAVVTGPSNRLIYESERILTPNVQRTVERNRIKRTTLDELISMEALTYQKRSVPYAVYYLSRNMEHALHCIAEELSTDEKERKAREFQRRYKDDIAGFMTFLQSPFVANNGSYEDTWSYIRQGTNSLVRGSNLHLVLDEPGGSPSNR